MARQFGCAHCSATITVMYLEAGEWKKEAECPECGEYSVVPEGDATATPGKQAKRDMFEGAGSTPAGTEPRSVSSTPTGKFYGKKKNPVVALGLSLGVPIGSVLIYFPIFALTYNTGIPFLLLPIPFALLDGSGQFYNEEVGKGCVFAGLGLGFYVLIFAVGTRLGMSGWGPDLLDQVVPFVVVLARLTSYVWASVDAYRSAERINVERGPTINVLRR